MIAIGSSRHDCFEQGCRGLVGVGELAALGGIKHPRGQLVIDQIAPSIAGTFDLAFGSDHLTGSFNALRALGPLRVYRPANSESTQPPCQ
jgi:hypothetical protein